MKKFRHKGGMAMESKEFAWQLFKNTGNIDAYMIMKACEIGEEITPNIDIISINSKTSY